MAPSSLPPSSPPRTSSSGTSASRAGSSEPDDQPRTKKRARDDGGDEKEIPLCRQGRGYRKLIDLAVDIQDLVTMADEYEREKANPPPELTIDDVAHPNDDDETALAKLEDEKKKQIARRRDLERAWDSVQLIPTILPSFYKDIVGSSPHVKHYYAEITRGANDGRSHDVSQLKQAMASWVNGLSGPFSPSPPLTDSRDNRGLQHDVCGRLLTPIDHDWDDPEVRAKFRAGAAAEGYVISAFARALYHKFEGDAERLEDGYLKSMLLVKTFQHIFTSPSSARRTDPQASDCENDPPAGRPRPQKRSRRSRPNVAKTLSMRSQVTPRAIAYAAVMLLFSLSSAPQWDTDEPHEGMNLVDIYYSIVDYFYPPDDDKESKKIVAGLLSWWNEKVFPGGAHSRSAPKGPSLQDKLAAQRAARARPLAPHN